MRCPSLTDLPSGPPGKKGWPFAEDSTRVDEAGWPLITIVTPSFNQASWLEECIRSVLLQGYPNLEYIIIDGGSTDGSVEIIRKYEPWLKYWTSEPDRGQGHALNKGFERGTGELFAWLNSDDFYFPGALQAVAKNWIARGRDCAIVGSGRELQSNGKWATIRNQDGQWSTMKRHGKLTFETVGAWDRNWILQQSCFFQASDFRATGGIDETLRYAFDVDLWLKLLRKTRFESIDDCLAVFRLHPQAKTQSERAQAFSETIMVQIRHGLEKEARRVMEREFSIAQNARKMLRPFHWIYRLLHSQKDEE
jgi:glycosyltransferase involved in cell wall biosynthesis